VFPDLQQYLRKDVWTHVLFLFPVLFTLSRLLDSRKNLYFLVPSVFVIVQPCSFTFTRILFESLRYTPRINSGAALVAVVFVLP